MAVAGPLHALVSREVLTSPSLEGRQRVELLKELERLTGELFQHHPDYAADRAALGDAPSQRTQLLRAVIEQQLSGIPEYSPQFYAALAASVRRQQLQRAAVLAALSALPHGFDQLDRCLICHAALVAGAYDAYHRAWLQAVQGNALAAELAAADQARQLPHELYNHYTVIVKVEGGSYSQVPYATFFAQEIAAIVIELDNWITVLTDVDTNQTAVKQQYLAFLKQYRACLAETDVAQLEDSWCQLDVLWMQIRHHVQVVHDIEYGYVDPLRCKVQPEFSLRILDDSYRHQNHTIQRIQGVMVSYFEQRPGRLAREGLAALRHSSAGLYYLPFLCGIGLHFRFAGQSIPNRSEVRAEWGVKIFADPVSSQTRAAAARVLALKVLADPSRAEAIDSLDSTVFLVAPHEVGHAIYSLDNLKQVIKPATKTLLEEPRAELTALHMLRLLGEGNHLSQEQVERLLCCFVLSDLRRFEAWNSSATRPYTVSAASCWARAEALGLVTLDGAGLVVMHDSKVPAFLGESSRLFEEIMAVEDELDGCAVESILARMEASGSNSRVVQHLVARLQKQEGVAQRPAASGSGGMADAAVQPAGEGNALPVA